MKTIILDQPEQLRLTETEPPLGPMAGQVQVRVRQVGICGTDLHAFKGRQPFFSYPRILGHELGVEVVALGQGVTNVALGDICAVEPYLNCGRCSACRRGKSNCCSHIQVLGVHQDGGMRELITVPAHKLHKSTKLPPDHLATVEMLCIGAHAVRRAQLEAQENVLVIGAGPIGLGVCQFAQLSGARVLVMEINQARVAFCQQHLGIESFVPTGAEAVTFLEETLHGDLPTTVFDATGNATSMMNAFNYVAHGGKLVYVGLFQGDVTFSDPHFHSREMTLLSSRNASSADFTWVIKMLESGRVNIAPWITHRTTPQNIVGEFPNWLKPESGVVKAMLEF